MKHAGLALQILMVVACFAMFMTVYRMEKKVGGYVHPDSIMTEIRNNLVEIRLVQARTDSVLLMERQIMLNEYDRIRNSSNFVNQIPHLSDDTLSVYYKNSWDYLVNSYRSGMLRPTE